jgi:hypothetical protein
MIRGTTRSTYGAGPTRFTAVRLACIQTTGAYNVKLHMATITTILSASVKRRNNIKQIEKHRIPTIIDLLTIINKCSNGKNVSKLLVL